MTPNRWPEKRLGSVLQKITEPVELEPDRLYQEIGIRSHGKGIFYKEPSLGSAIGDKRVFWVQPDALVLNIIFAWEQAIARTTERDRGLIASHRFPMFQEIENQCDIDYLLYFFKTKRGKSLLELASPGGAGRNKTLGQQEFFNIRVPLPPVGEQKAIAKAIATWDKSIEVMEGLIRNSKGQKKALMQEVLTGARRFRGYSTTWQRVRLAEIADVIVSNVDKKIHAGERPVSLCNYTDVFHSAYIIPSMSFMAATATEEEIKKFALKDGDVVITKDSETPDEIAVSACVRGKLDGVLCGYHLAIIRPRGGLADGAFLSGLFQLDDVRYHFKSKANGVTRFGLPIGVIKDVPFLIPSIAEQRQISSLIMVLDDEINMQTRRLVALKRERRAVMHVLLAGKGRVNVDGQPADVAVT